METHCVDVRDNYRRFGERTRITYSLFLFPREGSRYNRQIGVRWIDYHNLNGHAGFLVIKYIRLVDTTNMRLVSVVEEGETMSLGRGKGLTRFVRS